MKEEDRCFHYRGFLLMCDPTPAGRGFQANAVVIRRDGMSDAVLASSPSGVYFITEEAAVEYAMAWAVSWVDRNGVV